MINNKLKLGVLVSYMAAGISTVVSLIYTPFMLRMLGQSEYGVYQLIYSVAGYLSLLSFGFGSAYIRFFCRCKGEQAKEKIASLNGMFMSIFCVMSLICIIVGSIIVVNVQNIFATKLSSTEIQTAKKLLAFLVVNVALTFPNSVFDSYIIAHEQFMFQKVVYLIKTVINPILTIPFLLVGFKSVTLVVITTVLTVVSFMINWIYCRKRLNIEFKFNNFERGIFKEISVFSSFIFLNIVTDQINWNLDKFILGIYAGAKSVAVYGVAAQLNTYYMSCSTIISSVFIPKVNRIVANNDENAVLSNLFIKVGRIQFMIMTLVCSGFAFFGKTFIRYWAGDGYEQAYIVALMFLVAGLIPMIQNIGIEIQKAKNQHKFRSIVYVAVSVVNLFLSILLAPQFGVLGCAFGTAVSLIIGNVIIMNLYYQRKIKLDMKRFWGNIISFVPALLIPILFGVLMNAFLNLNNIYIYLMCILGYTLIFVLALYKFGMNNFEKDLIKSYVKKIFRR